MSTNLVVEVALMFLLTVTLGYCIVLERRLASVRRGQDGLKSTLGELDASITNTGAALRALKAAVSSAADTLDERLARARSAIDELSLLTVAGERIAERFDRAATPSAQSRTMNPSLPSGTIMGRIDSLRAVR